jgi:hypothetical protein
MPGKKNRVVYQLKVTLRDLHPPIWRRIQVWDDTTLAQLHRILQITIGWEDAHLHEFHIGPGVYGMPDPDDERTVFDERCHRLRELVPQVGTSFEYVYDFGDNWRHELLFEEVVPPDQEQQYPRCLVGERCAPPEDVGGPTGYADYLEAMTDISHEEHDSMLEWRGPFDAELFSLAVVNRRLQKKLR